MDSRDNPIVINRICGQGPLTFDKDNNRRINLLSTRGGILGSNPAVRFPKKYRTARCATSHEDDARIPRHEQALTTPRPRPVQTDEDGIEDDDRARSD